MTLQTLETLFESHPAMSWLALAALFNVAITAIDMVYDFVTGANRDWKDTASNIAIDIGKRLLSRTFVGLLGLLALHSAGSWLWWEIPMHPWTWALSLIVADLTYYWMHRFEHENRFLWAYHAVHHSSESYNLTTAGRLAWVEDLIEWVFLIPMILMGFNVFQAVVSLAFVAAYQHWIHTERVGRLGFLEGWVNTPSVHRVHHGSNRKYWDKNYGGILMIWDRLFGTYQAEEEPVIYGISERVASRNPFVINFIEYGRIWSDVRRATGIGEAIRAAFGRTGAALESRERGLASDGRS
ncbi:MAG: sterol desaturase family protein [Myxococcota bacterium]